MVRGKTPAQLVALYIGVWWTFNGIAVFTTGDPNFGTSPVHGASDFLGIHVAVNGWHGVFHLIPGLLGLACAWRPAAARNYLFGAAGLYLLAAGWGFVAGGDSLGVMSVDTLGNFVHLGEGLIALSGALLSQPALELAQPASR